MFFTFWGLSVLRKNPAPEVKKNFVSRMFGFMLPKGPEKLAISKLNMMGMGSAMMKSVMKRKPVLSLPELIRSAPQSLCFREKSHHIGAGGCSELFWQVSMRV